MKRRFSKILGVGLTLALLASFLVMAAPVSALTQPTVTVDDLTISVTTDYSIVFDLGVRLGGTSTLSFSALSDRVVTVTTSGTATATLTWPALTTVTTTGTSGAVIGTTSSITFTGAGGSQAAETVVLTLTDGAVSSISAGGGTTGTATVSDAALPTDSIIIDFDEDTDIASLASVTVAATSGIGTPAWGPTPMTSTGVVDQELTIDMPLAIGVGAMVQVVVSGVVNPDAVGDYTLDVSTSNEDAKTSTSFTLGVPDIPGLPGVSSVYNSTGVLMAREISIGAAVAKVTGVDFTIQVGPGTYTEASIPALDVEGLTLVSTDGAGTTIIKGTVTIDALDVTVDGFTFDITSGTAITVTSAGTDAIVQNNIIIGDDSYPEGIRLEGTGATVSANELSLYSTMMVMGATDCTLSDNIFGAGINIDGSTGIDITGNDLTGSELVGIRFGSGDSEDILIEGNTISEVTASANARDAGIGFLAAITVTNLQIIGNDITDNLGDGIVIPADVTLIDPIIKFNTISGNEDYGIDNLHTTGVDATLNYWGPDGVSENGTVTTDPVLAGTAEAVFSATKVGTGQALDAKDTVGVNVSVTDFTVDTISVAKYTANPQEAIADAIAFYDVYVDGVATNDAMVTIKFYTGDALTDVYLWSAGTQIWSLQTSSFSAFGGFVSVAVDPAYLGGTPFALVGGAAAALTAPTIISPDVGEKAVDLRPTFAWTAIAGVLGYEFELADNPNFVAPLMKLSGELGRLIVPYYQYMPQLDYSKAYYWRVRSVDATAESGWVGGVFITVAEVIPEPEEPEWMCSEGLTFDSREALEAHLATAEAHKPVEPPEIIVEPDVEVIVPLPAETSITPAWIYVIIGVGAVLVIALIILIVRTRRVA